MALFSSWKGQGREFHRDCCNSIAVTRDARIGNVTNHRGRVCLVLKLGSVGVGSCTLGVRLYSVRVGLGSAPRNEEFNDIVDVHVGHVNVRGKFLSLLYFDVSVSIDVQNLPPLRVTVFIFGTQLQTHGPLPWTHNSFFRFARAPPLAKMEEESYDNWRPGVTIF